MPTVLITGASRGLGLEFARQYAADGWRVIATCRNPARADQLRALSGEVAHHALDVSDIGAIQALGRKLADDTIDVLIANAGIYIARSTTPHEIDVAGWLESFKVNTIGALACAGAFLVPVQRSRERKMIAVSSVSGSVTSVRHGSFYAYRSSKAALNMSWRIFAFDHREVIAAAVSPGSVGTEMNPNGPGKPEDAVTSLRKVIARLTPQDSGSFFRVDGTPAPW